MNGKRIVWHILALKKIRRQREKIWRQSPITINYDLYYESCEAVKNAIKDSKTVTIQNKINDCKGDQKKIFKIIDSLLGRKNNKFCQNIPVHSLLPL